MENDGAVSESKCTYDVFLSFRGEDTRHTFTSHLYDELCRKGIMTFMDNEELKRGDELGPTLLKAIEESRISVVVFSDNYADSSWCLDELVKIHDCKKSKNQLVYPIFYNVDPSDVRHQRGSYGEAMTKHESKFGKESDKLHKWRLALTDIANLKGDHLKVEQGDESRFIKGFVGEIFIKVSPKDLSSNEHIVGREHIVEELKSLLDLESRHITCLLGIHGTGGIGKTTLAKALYDSIYKHFEASSFLSDVRDASNQKGLEHLQQRLLKDILEVRNVSLDSKEEGIRQIKSRLGLKRVLIVLDDVDNIEQLKSLAGEPKWFGDGSRIIITTRDKHLLDLGRVEKKYKVKLLKNQESLELFCQSAFGESFPESGYEDMSYRAMRCCKGLPLALKVLGSHMVGKKFGEWKDALDRFEKSPHPGVQRVLRISYDSLHFNEKNIFLDIACFFKGRKLEHVLRAWDSGSGDVITTLVDKSLLTVDKKYNYLGMHDLIQDMGKEIVKEGAWNEVGKHSRLWHHDDVLQVLADNNGSSKIQGIMLHPPKREEIKCIATVFKKMKNLRILIVRNTRFLQGPCYLPNNLRLLDWENYPSQSFPPDFYPRQIGAFNLRGSLLVLRKAFQKFEHLTYMDISFCYMVTEFPDVSEAKNLRELRLDGCENLVSIHKSVGCLANLVVLSASGCTQLQSFVPTIYLPSLKYLSLDRCRRLAHFPQIMGTMDEPLEIHMKDTAIKELPESIEKLTGLNYLEMTGCTELQHLPSSLFMLPNFVTLKIGYCHDLQLPESFRGFKGNHSACPRLETLHFDEAGLSEEDIGMFIHNFPNLRDLNVSGNYFVSLPKHIIESTNLTSLDVSGCMNLQDIPELPSSVEKVDARSCDRLTSQTSTILWSQVRKEIKRLEMKIPRSEIPKWFHYINKGGFPVLKARGKFPAVALAFVFEKLDRKGTITPEVHMTDHVDMHLFIEGESRGYHIFNWIGNHVVLLDLQVLLSLEEWEGLSLGVSNNDWKIIQVYCKTDLKLSSWGVYVYETNMDDIQFTTQELNASLVSRLDAINEEEKVRRNKEDSRSGETWVNTVTYKGKKMFMSPREGEGTSGFNMDPDSLVEWLKKMNNDDGSASSSQQGYEQDSPKKMTNTSKKQKRKIRAQKKKDGSSGSSKVLEETTPSADENILIEWTKI